MPDRPYIFLELTSSLCPDCLRRVEAKVIAQGNDVFLLKRCPDHGLQKVLISTDLEYYKLTRQLLRPGQMPLHFGAEVDRGCPFDCGLCPDHEQHSCLTLLEITEQCNLECPVCYACSCRDSRHRSLDHLEFMLNSIERAEGQPDVVQISGGEPTIHPQFFEILDAAKSRPIKHLMVNTNGLRIAEDESFAARLKNYMPGFEVYLQFDSLDGPTLKELRGRDLRESRLRAIDRLNRHNISTTLVVTLKKGSNDNQIGQIIDFALKQRCVRGVSFQPIQAAGRLHGIDPQRHRLTLSEVRQQILQQSKLFKPEDIVPVPCHPECLAMAYALKHSGMVLPLARLVDVKALLAAGGNTIAYERQLEVRQHVRKLFSTGASPLSSAGLLSKLFCCLPKLKIPGEVTYENIFRLTIMQFMDAWSFDVRSVKKSCVHIVHPDGRIIPFDTYNIFHRGHRAQRISAVTAEQEVAS